MIYKDFSQNANKVPTIEISTITDGARVITTNEPITGKQTICDKKCSTLILEPFVKDTLEPVTEPSVDDPRTNEMRTEIIDSTLPTTGFDKKIVIEYE